MTENSAVYIGTVLHKRLRPRTHQFTYRCFWLLLDLDEIEGATRRLRLFSHNRFNLFSFYDRDHGHNPAVSLRTQIGDKLGAAGIDFPKGTIRLLCMPRLLGYVFNPLSIYFCQRPDGSTAALVYEVHNTFGERHSYVIPAVQTGEPISQTCDKAFYVSPFLDMDLRYDFTVSGPDQQLRVIIRTSQSEATMLIATIAGKRCALHDGALLRLFFLMPVVTLKVIAAIHWQALRLWLKGLNIRPHQAQTAPTSRQLSRD